MKKLFIQCWLVGVFFSFSHLLMAQKTGSVPVKRPKLVVGIVIDQMRWDYLYRYASRFSTGGFNRILKKGFSCENTFVPYTPTYTAPGHTCIYTGSVPAIHGIIGNFWYEKGLKKMWYCTADSNVLSVGGAESAGKMSPSNMWTTTVTDELKLATNFQSKVIGIALKDRGAILPAGHAANAAYWFDDSTGNFMSSTYYMQQLPGWLVQFNNQHYPEKYLQQNWNTLFPLDSYIQSTDDKKNYENSSSSMPNFFPHNTASIEKNRNNALRFTPWGNTLTFEMAKAAIEGEQLGKSSACDFLALSFSSPDYIGHYYGPNSVETEDNYLRLDRELASFIQYLDKSVGKDQYLLFLTADHAVAQIPGFLKEHHLPGGTMDEATMERELNARCKELFNIEKAVEKVTNYQVFINQNLDPQKYEVVKKTLMNELMLRPNIAMAIDLHDLSETNVPEVVKKMVINGYNQKLSGDIQFIFKPHWFDGSDKGTTHGSWNPYDSHIPLLWYGWNIKHGISHQYYEMTDIAPTIAAFLHIQMPSGNIGKVITEIIK